MAITGYTKLGFTPKNYQASDQGAYYTFTNPTVGTGIIGGVVTSQADTTPLLLIQNGNPVGSGINVYMDCLKLTVSVVGVGHTIPYVSLKIDRSTTTTRYTSGGTQITPQASAANSPNPNGKANVYFGAITAAAAGTGALLASYRIKGAIEVVLDSFTFDFGAPEQQPQNGLADNGATISHGLFNMPPVILGPSQTALLHWWAAANSTGVTWFLNGGYWEI
jgi:hypothetical protein